MAVERDIDTLAKPTSVLIAPFDAADLQVRDAIQAALAEMGVEVFRPDFVRVPYSAAAAALEAAIRRSDFVLADVTHQNPNVFYELGYAQALRKPTILLLDSEAGRSLPADLQGLPFITYGPNNLAGLKEQIKRAVRVYAAVEYA